MILREPTNHYNDCYFCMTNLFGFNKKNRKKILYPLISLVVQPVSHSGDMPVPVFKAMLDIPVSVITQFAQNSVNDELTESDSDQFLDHEN